MALSFKFSTSSAACLFGKVQEQVNSVVVWLTVNRVPQWQGFIYNVIALTDGLDDLHTY